MLDRLLVPLDGSELAEWTLPHVVALARAFASHVVFVRVLDTVQLGDLQTVVSPRRWRVFRTEAEAYLNSIVARLANTGISMETALLEGQAAERIIQFVRDPNSDLIVLSSHGRSGPSQWNMSSVTQKVLSGSCGSTLIVRSSRPGQDDTTQWRYKRLLVPLDGSLRAECVLPLATALARRSDAQLVIAHAVGKPEMPHRTPLTEEEVEIVDRLLERNREEALSYFRQLQTRLPLELETRLVEGESVVSSLHDWVDQESADLVILSAHGHSGETRHPYGSVATSFVAYSTTSLLIYQDAPAEQTQAAREDAATARSREAPMHA